MNHGQSKIFEKVLTHRFREWAAEEGRQGSDAGWSRWSHSTGTAIRQGRPLHWSVSRFSIAAESETHRSLGVTPPLPTGPEDCHARDLGAEVLFANRSYVGVKWNVYTRHDRPRWDVFGQLGRAMRTRIISTDVTTYAKGGELQCHDSAHQP